MKKILMITIIGGLVGCGPSAQEKLAQEQLKAIEQQKAMLAGFEAESKKMQEQLKALPPPGQEKMVYKKLDLYPPKK